MENILNGAEEMNTPLIRYYHGPSLGQGGVRRELDNFISHGCQANIPLTQAKSGGRKASLGLRHILLPRCFSKTSFEPGDVVGNKSGLQPDG